MHGKMLKLVREIYSKVKATVQTKDGLTKLFDCILGVRQGCMLSPRLFIIFINELELMLRQSEFRGISMGNTIEIFLLMYADDIVILGDTVLELQRKIRVLEVNLSKTKVIVFRNGGVMSKSEKFFYRGEKVKTVTYYRYLGLIFSSRNLWSKALSTLAAQAEKALSTVRRMIWKLGHPNPDVAFKIFDARITPILLWSRTLGIRITSPNRTSSHWILQIYFRPWTECTLECSTG